MSDLNCHFVTFNCGRELVEIDYFAASICSSFPAAAPPPDLIALSLQEIAPLAHSFLGGSYLDAYYDHLQAAVLRATQYQFKDEDWVNVANSNLGMTAIMLFARRKLQSQIKWIEEAGTGVGVADTGNKGAVGLRLALDEDDATVVTFVAAHLAPGEAAWKRRNADWKAICENLVFQARGSSDAKSINTSAAVEEEAEPLLQGTDPTSKPSNAINGLFSKPSYIFFGGDLNYRTSDSKPEEGAASSWPQLGSDASALLDNDQLTRERQAKRTLHHLSESSIDFPPTYKYSSETQKLVAKHISSTPPSKNKLTPTLSDAEVLQIATTGSEKVQLYAEHRVPSWCDRILYLEAAPIDIHSYATLPIQSTSDHRPVVLSCSIPRRPLLAMEFPAQDTFELRSDWQARRHTARRYEVAVGLGTYLGLTGQGQTILLASVGTIVAGAVLLVYLTG